MEPSFEQFSTQARQDGYSEVLERRWPADAEIATHSHPFEAAAVVVHGEMWLTVDGTTRYLRPGDRFHLAPGTPHEERYGADGAVYWVARR